MLIALLTYLLLGQGSATSVLLEDLAYMEKSIRRSVDDEAVQAEALALVREIRDQSTRYNRQREKAIKAFLESENPLQKPAGEVARQLEDFEESTRTAQMEVIRFIPRAALWPDPRPVGGDRTLTRFQMNFGYFCHALTHFRCSLHFSHPPDCLLGSAAGTA
jgi:hypothetical protein